MSRAEHLHPPDEQGTPGHDSGHSVSQSALTTSHPSPDFGAEGDLAKQDTADTRICRSSWPKDPDAKRAALAKILPQAAREYFGNTPVIAFRLNVDEDEIHDLAASDYEVARAFARAEDLLCALAEDRIAQSILGGGPSSDAKFFLERRYPEKYARKAGTSDSNRNLDVPKKDLHSVLDGPKPKAED